MSDFTDEDKQLRQRINNAVPSWVLGFCAVMLSFGLTMNWLGLNFAGPLQVIAYAYAENIKVQLEKQGSDVSDIRLSLDAMQKDIEHLKENSHPPGPSQSHDF